MDLTSSWKFEDVQRFAEASVDSGLFKEITSVARAIVIIQMGLEAGVPPAASLKGIQIIEGKPEYAPALLLGVIERSGAGYVKVVRCDNELCVLEAHVRRPGGEHEAQPLIEFGVEDAKAITNYSKEKGRRVALIEKGSYANGYLSDMFFARCAGRVARRYFSHVTLGAVYGLGEIQDMAEPSGATAEPTREEPKPATTRRRSATEPTDTPSGSEDGGGNEEAERPVLTETGKEKAKAQPTAGTINMDGVDLPPTDPESPEYLAWYSHLTRGEKKMIGSVPGKQLATYYNNNKEKLSDDELSAIRVVIDYRRAMSKRIKEKLAQQAGENAAGPALAEVQEVFPDSKVVDVSAGDVSLKDLGETKMIGSAKYQGIAWKQIDPEYLEAFIKKNAALLPPGYAEDAERYLSWRLELEQIRQQEIERDGIPEFEITTPEQAAFEEP